MVDGTCECPLPHDDYEADAFCELAPGIWLALIERKGNDRWTASTCLTSGGFSPEKRARRSEQRRRRRVKRRYQSHRNRRGRPEAA